MRIRTFILCLLCCVASAFAKDVITKTDGTKLDAKVEEITETVIKYRKASNPTGPVYTIPISSVATVLYENGDMDTFNDVKTSNVSNYSQTVSSDENLILLSESQLDYNHPETPSDAELLRIASLTPYNEFLRKANIYRKIGLYGGGGLLLVGLGLGITCACYENFQGFAIGAVSGLVAGGVWYLCFNLKANSLMKQAREMQVYSAVYIENEIVQFGNNKLTAGISMMGNRMVNSHGLGLSIGLTF